MKTPSCLTLDFKEYAGGSALWGLLPPVYNTSKVLLEHGIHVHCRRVEEGDKIVDRTYDVVQVKFLNKQISSQVIEITRTMAVNYVIAQVFNIEMSYLVCTRCNHPHLDYGIRSISPHVEHECENCGTDFASDKETVGNPIVGIRETLPQHNGNIPVSPKRHIEIEQKDFPRGIQLWGSNRSILWARDKEEECGIHLHCYQNEKYRRVIDDTYASVVVDGICIDQNMLRLYMAQCAFPHLSEAVESLLCPYCATPHFDRDTWAYRPHKMHLCFGCKREFSSPSDKPYTIGNPMKKILQDLSRNTFLNNRWHYGFYEDNSLNWSDTVEWKKSEQEMVA